MKQVLGFRRDEGGNIAVIAAIAIIPILAVAGMAIDFQLVITKKNTVQHTLDATLIAAARERQTGTEGDDLESFVRDQFNTFIALNDQAIQCEPVRVALVDGTEAIDASVRCAQSTSLMSLFGTDEVNFTVSSGTIYGVGEVDVAFVFDLSGSMNTDGRLEALKTAAIDAVNTLIPDNNQNNQDVRLAFIGYNHAIDAGEYFDDVVDFNRRPSGIENSELVGDIYEDEIIGVVQIDSQNNRTFFDYEKVDCTDGDRNFNVNRCDDYVDFAARFYHSSTCVYNRIGDGAYTFDRTGDDAFTDAAPGNNAWMVAGHPLWDYADNFEERNRRADFRDKYNGEDEVEDQIGQWRSRNEGLRNARGVDSTPDDRGAITFHSRHDQCRSEGRPLPLTNNKTVLFDYINGMNASNGTAGHLGLAWGWYLISPNWSSIWPAASEPHDYNEPDTAKALILMTDGDFNDQHPFSAAGATDLAARYCDNIRANTNITVFTVGFQVPSGVATVDGTNQTILDYCATRPDLAFNADSAQELTEAYSQIAAQISDLRITN
ncbi:MAG: pilus assembly protein TadG-related protein [Pseudomonadota bacterium]